MVEQQVVLEGLGKRFANFHRHLYQFAVRATNHALEFCHLRSGQAELFVEFEATAAVVEFDEVVQ